MIHNPILIADMHSSSVAALHELESKQQLSFYANTSHLLSKALLLACASFYEHTITEFVGNLVRTTRAHDDVEQWLHRAAVEGQFFKWFCFQSAKNTNTFLSLFGNTFKTYARGLLDSTNYRRRAEQSFLTVCTKRNECVHRNFGAYALELSVEDVYTEHRRAMTYVRVIEYALATRLIPATKLTAAGF